VADRLSKEVWRQGDLKYAKTETIHPAMNQNLFFHIMLSTGVSL
jgi:hypothetical protein